MLIPFLFLLGLILKLFELFGPQMMILIFFVVGIIIFMVIKKAAKGQQTKKNNRGIRALSLNKDSKRKKNTKKVEVNKKKSASSDLANTLNNVASLKGTTIISRETPMKYSQDGVDFSNIKTVIILDYQKTYRIEEKEEFDPVMTNFLTEQDGWQHYETNVVKYQVENGYEYKFFVSYIDGRHEIYVLHESSPIAQKLVEINENPGLQQNNVDGFNEAANTLSSEDLFFSGNVYETAKENFEKMCFVYGLSSQSTEKEIVDACGVKLTSIIFSLDKKRVNDICELMYFLLCETEDDADKFDYPNINKVNFTQKHSGGIDAFCVLEYGADVDDETIREFDNLRQQKGYRKICLLTIGNNKSTLNKETVLVWDMVTLIQAYLKAFKKIIGIVGDKPSPFRCVDSEVDENSVISSDFVVIDIETTGTNFNCQSPDMDEILSVSIIDGNGNVLFDKLCGTEYKRSWDEAEKINGISPEDVYGLNTFSDILSEVLLILSSYDNVIAYNISFEKQFIEAYIKRDAEFYSGEYDINWRFDLDPMELYKNYVGSNKWIKLETAANSFGYTFNAHNSLEDAKATLFVFNKIREKS